MKVIIQEQDFNAGLEINKLQQNNSSGAIVSFVGSVRGNDDFLALEIEHYPKMTKNAILQIVDQASKRWQIIDSLVIHRIGKLAVNQQIVLVAVSSKHRGIAFSACEYIIDYLKTQAPFWKKEYSKQGSHWVASRDSDLQAKSKWG